MKSKMSLIAITLFMALCFNLYSQNSNSEVTQNSENSVEQSYSFESDTAYFGQSDNTESQISSNRPKSSLGFLIRTIIILILIAAAVYGVLFYIKKKNSAPVPEDDFLRRVSSLPLGPGKSIEIITLVDKGYIVGVTDHNINMLGEVEDKELIEALNLNYDKKLSTKKPMNFTDVLELFMPRNVNTKNESIYSEAESNLNEDSGTTVSDTTSQNDDN